MPLSLRIRNTAETDVCPGAFTCEDCWKVLDLARRYAFAVPVSVDGDIPFATHLPLIVTELEGAMLRSITGIRMRVERVPGKQKTGTEPPQEGPSGAPRTLERAFGGEPDTGALEIRQLMLGELNA